MIKHNRILKTVTHRLLIFLFILYWIVLSHFYCPVSAEAQTNLVINEIMYDPLTGNPEWVELFNAGSSQVDLHQWTLSDASATESQVNTTFIIEPDGYVVLSESPQLGHYQTDQAKIYVPETFPSLNNSGDQLSLKNSSGTVIDSVQYAGSSGGGDGISLERISPFVSGLVETNWDGSEDVSGATPTMRNSLAPENYDLSLLTVDAPKSINPDGVVAISVMVSNVGFESFSDYTLRLYHDINENETAEPSERRETITGSFMAAGDTVVHAITLTIAGSGYHKILVKLDADLDENLDNNSRQTEIIIGYTERSVLISELMYRPESGEPEWLEIFVAGDSVDLRGFAIRDKGHSGTINFAPHQYYYGDYMVLAADSSVLQSYSDADFDLVMVEDFPTFNNGSDSVKIIDGNGTIMDALFYTDQWGGGSGISLERKSINALTQYIHNWDSSISPVGATPGGNNSLEEQHLSLFSVSRSDTVEHSLPDAEISIEYNALNISPDSVIEPVFSLGFDINNDSLLSPNEIQQTVRLQPIHPGDSVRFRQDIRTPVSPGYHNILLSLKGNIYKVIHVSAHWIPFQRQALLLNEFLVDPSGYYPGEFVECVNISNQPVPLQQWQILINNRQIVLDTAIEVPPSSYTVISQEMISGMNSALILPASWSSIPNEEATIILLDPYYYVIDSLHYNDQWEFQEGRSQERLHLQPGNHSTANWEPSFALEGATPGQPNSLYSPRDSVEIGWEISPEMFSPDGDGHDDVLQIRYEGFHALKYVTILIYDTAGRLVTELARDEGAGTVTVWTWEGLSNKGNILPIGNYLVHIEYYTTNGTEGTLLKRIVLAKPL